MARSPLAATRRVVVACLSVALVLASSLVSSAAAAAAAVATASGPVRFVPISLAPANASPAGPRGVMGANSNDWAGWAASGNHYTSVTASWTQPSVQCASHENSGSAFWVGLDGYNSNSVEQVGVFARCSNGSAFYVPWTEFYPAAAQFGWQPIRPGDAMSVTAAFTGGHSYRLTISDAHHWSVALSGYAPHASNVSAEVVTEAPTDGNTGRVMPLSNFHSVSFANAAVNGRSMSQASQLHQVIMGSARRVMAQPTGLSGTSFGVSWRSASG